MINNNYFYINFNEKGLKFFNLKHLFLNYLEIKKIQKQKMIEESNLVQELNLEPTKENLQEEKISKTKKFIESHTKEEIIQYIYSSKGLTYKDVNDTYEYAAKNNDVELLNYLLETKRYKLAYSYIFMILANENSITCLDYFRDKIGDITNIISRCMYDVIKTCSLESVNWLLNNFFGKLNMKHLTSAINSGRLEIVQTVWERNPTLKLKLNNFEVLRKALYKNYFDICTYLFNKRKWKQNEIYNFYGYLYLNLICYNDNVILGIQEELIEEIIWLNNQFGENQFFTNRNESEDGGTYETNCTSYEKFVRLAYSTSSFLLLDWLLRLNPMYDFFTLQKDTIYYLIIKSYNQDSFEHLLNFYKEQIISDNWFEILLNFIEKQNDLGESIILFDSKIKSIIETIIKVYREDANVDYSNDKLFILLKRCYHFIKNDVHQNIFNTALPNKFITFIENFFNNYHSTSVESYTKEGYDFSKPEKSKYIVDFPGESNYIKLVKTKKKVFNNT